MNRENKYALTTRDITSSNAKGWKEMGNFILNKACEDGFITQNEVFKALENGMDYGLGILARDMLKLSLAKNKVLRFYFTKEEIITNTLF